MCWCAVKHLHTHSPQSPHGARTSSGVWSRDVDSEHVTKIHRTALQSCGYPSWMFEKVKQDQRNIELKASKTNKKSTCDQRDVGLLVIPYVEWLTEATERIFRKYGISTAMKPYKMLTNLLVHPKDKRTVVQTGMHVRKTRKFCQNVQTM